MEKAPQKEKPSVIDIQFRLNKEMKELDTKRELPNSGDIKWAEGVLITIDSLLEDENVRNSQEDTEDLLKKRQKIEDFIAESKEGLE